VGNPVSKLLPPFQRTGEKELPLRLHLPVIKDKGKGKGKGILSKLLSQWQKSMKSARSFPFFFGNYLMFKAVFFRMLVLPAWILPFLLSSSSKSFEANSRKFASQSARNVKL
jgi:hypothetical protein